MRTRRIRSSGLKAFKASLISLVLLSGLLGSIPAFAFSNARVVEGEVTRWVIEDVAICTNYKYNFDAPTTWAQTGYETCSSETITTASLPATLHFKFRVQSLTPEEFLASIADAYLMDNRGRRVTTGRWATTPLVNLDGPFNQRDAIYYGAFLLSDSKSFPARSYTLYLEVWNSQWVKMNGPNLPERPETLKAFTFTISQGPEPVAPVQVDCTVPNAQFPKTLASAEESIKAISSKISTVTDLNAFGIAGLLRDYRKMLQDEVAKLTRTASEAETVYSGKSTCLDQYRGSISNISNLATNAQANIEAALSKAEYLEKLQGDPCTRDSQAARSSIDKSSLAITSISDEIAADEAKGGGLIDIKDPATLKKLEGWKFQLRDAAKNLAEWAEKLESAYKRDGACVTYQNLRDESISKTAQSANADSKVTALISKANTIQGNKPKSSVQEEVLPESDGAEEEPQAKLTVSFNNSQNRFIIKVEGNLPEENLAVRAIKKGSRTLRFTIKTNEEGEGGIRTRSKLNGYTLILSLDSVKLDSFRVK